MSMPGTGPDWNPRPLPEEIEIEAAERDPAPCGHCGATDHDTGHCPGQGG